MKQRWPIFLLAVLFAALAGGLVLVFQWRLGTDDQFPVYSSFRTDPLGIAAFHDSLAQLPQLRVQRNLEPLDRLAAKPPRTIILAGTSSGNWDRMNGDEADALAAAVRAGCRLVVAFRAQAAEARYGEGALPAGKPAAPKSEDEKKKNKPELKNLRNSAVAALPGDLSKRFGVKIQTRWLLEPGAEGATCADATLQHELPANVKWASDIYFDLDHDAGWHVIYRRGGSPVVVERHLGFGSIVLAGDSYFLSNEALQRDRATSLLTWILGPNRTVVFDETHLGVEEHPGLAALARRYGLSATFFSLFVLAALFIWQRTALFIPPAAEQEEVGLTYHPAAGLTSLLRRAIAPDELVSSAFEEWRPTAREADRARAEMALAGVAKTAPPVTRYNAVVRALRKTSGADARRP